MVFAVTDQEKGADGGVTCFPVDHDMGWTSESAAGTRTEPVPRAGEHATGPVLVRPRCQATSTRSTTNTRVSPGLMAGVGLWSP